MQFQNGSYPISCKSCSSSLTQHFKGANKGVRTFFFAYSRWNKEKKERMEAFFKLFCVMMKMFPGTSIGSTKKVSHEKLKVRKEYKKTFMTCSKVTKTAHISSFFWSRRWPLLFSFCVSRNDVNNMNKHKYFAQTWKMFPFLYFLKSISFCKHSSSQLYLFNSFGSYLCIL